jgi:hypothetical protein
MPEEPKMKILILLLACLSSVPLSLQAAGLYRWVDSSGVVHYSDMPSPDAEKMDSRKFSGAVTPSDNLPYETRRAQQNFPVTLYTGDGCRDMCDQARNLLNKRGVPFSEKLLRTPQDIEDFKQLSGIDGVVPTLGIGRNFLKGFLDSRWNSELDIAGYPKTASYRQRIAPLPSIPTAEGKDQPAGGRGVLSKPPTQ